MEIKGFTKGRKLARRALGAYLAALMTLMSGVSAYAAAKRPVCDEAMYVTLDAYGKVTNTSVVKSYDLHGSTEVVDYGRYTEITNMTDYGTPEVEGNRVTFSIPETPENDRFYFEGKLEPEEVEAALPWNLSVSYRLNGVEKHMEDLPHEKGLVEITIDAIPNRRTNEYYRNNMTLEITAIVDMDKNLSVEAPGAQIQSVGNMKAVLFMVMPGEEQHFEIRIGSNDFEFSGLAFMMVPVTLSQLDRLGDLREARDTVKDSADAIGDSMDIILDSLDGIQGGLSGTVDGLRNLDESRKIISNAKDGIYVDADGALAVLKELSERGVPFTSYVQEAQNALNDTNKNINQINNRLSELDNQLENLGWGLRNVSRDLDDAADLMKDTRHDIGSFENKLSSLRQDLADLKNSKALVNQKLEELKAILEQLKGLKEQIEEHGDVIGLTPEQKAELMGTLESVLEGAGMSEAEMKRLIKAVASSSDAIEAAGGLDEGAVAAASAGFDKLIALLEGFIGTLEKPSKIDAMISSTEKSIASLEEIVSRVHDDGESLENVLATTGDLADTLKSGAVTGQGLVGDVNDVVKTVNDYHGTAQAALNDAGLLVDSAVRGTDAMYILMTDVEANLRAAGEPLDKGAGKTIAGLTSALDAALDGLAKTGVIRDAKTTVEDLVDEKWDEYTGEDMTILNADVNARKVSFTSDRNPEPQSIQIILRTEGTEEAEDEAEAEIDEDFHAEGNFFDRIWSILVKIVEAIKGIFS